MTNQPFFIIGSKRGGTTLLRLMLNKHDALTVPPESHFILPLVKRFNQLLQPLTQQELEEAKSIVVNHPRFDTWKMNSAEVDDIIKQLPQPYYLAGFIDALFRYKIKDYNKERWGEKTPEYIDIIPQLNSLFPESKFIALVRDGRDVAISLKDRGWEGWSIYQRATYWRRCIRNIVFLKQLNNRQILIRYEDLVTEPGKILQQVTQFLGVTFNPDMLEFNKDYSKNITDVEIKTGVHTKLKRQPDAKEDIGRWKKQLSNSAVWRFESVCYKELAAMDYEVAKYKPRNALHILAAYGYKLTGKIIVLAHTLYHAIFSKELKQNFRKNKAYSKFRSVVIKS